MSSTEKNSNFPARARIQQGHVLCPRCGRLLAKAYSGAEARGLELWCGGKGCKMPVLVEL